MIKKILLGLTAVIVTLFLAAIIGMVILINAHTFQASVSGRITDTQGNPIHGAKVGLHIRGTNPETYDYEKVTDQSGHYSIHTPTIRYSLDTSPGGHRISIYADGYVPVQSVKKRVAKGSNRNWDFALTKVFSVSGRLVNTKGEPMANRTLTFFHNTQTDSESTLNYKFVVVKTNAEGIFKMVNVGPFEYRIVIAERGQKRFIQKPISGRIINLAEVANGKTLEICINDPLDYTISGHAIDSLGNPVSKAHVWVFYDRIGSWSAYTDHDGAFCIIGLDGLGKDVFDLSVKGVKRDGENFEMEITNVKLHSENLQFVVQ